MNERIETYLRFLAMSELAQRYAPRDKDGYKPFEDLAIGCAKEAMALINAHLLVPSSTDQEPKKTESSDLQCSTEDPQCLAGGSR